VGRVAEDRGGDAAATGSGRQSRVFPALNGVDPVLDEVSDISDEWDDSCPFALGALVDEPAG
jgi:hypothetical protein